MPTGSCVCKKVTYSFSGEPAGKAICHCNECQKLSGTAFTYNVLVPRTSFTWTSGESLVKYNSFIQEIGVEIGYRFCSECSAVLLKESEADAFKPVYMIQAGSIDKEAVTPKGIVGQTPDVELWTSRKVEWLTPVQGAQQKMQFE
ncbi:DUF636 domain protein, partial [Thozetella sp. PMI_491]